MVTHTNTEEEKTLYYTKMDNYANKFIKQKILSLNDI